MQTITCNHKHAKINSTDGHSLNKTWWFEALPLVMADPGFLG